MEVILLLLSVAPPLLILWYFQASDRYPEPPRVIWTSFLLGMLSCAPVAVVGTVVGLFASGIHAVWAKGSFDAFFAAALPEEFAKFLVLYLYCARRTEFDEPMDGLVYGMMVLVADALPKGDPTIAPLWIAWLCLVAVQFVLAKLLRDAHVRRQDARIR